MEIEKIKQKKRNKTKISLVLIFILLILPVTIFSYYTNMHKFFDISRTDDGYLGNSLSRNADEFLVDGCGVDTMLDTLTGICWDEQTNRDGMKNWNDATSYCSGLSHGGHTDWMLPALTEFYTLSNEYGAIGTTVTDLLSFGFLGVSGNYYWTKTTVYGVPANAVTFNMDNIYSGSAVKASASYNVICVRKDYS